MSKYEKALSYIIKHLLDGDDMYQIIQDVIVYYRINEQQAYELLEGYKESLRY